MLGYTWVVFEKFSVLFSRDGYLSSAKFLYFSHEMGTLFQETFCIFCARWVLFVGIFGVFYKRWVRFMQKFSVFSSKVGILKRTFSAFWFQSGWFPCLSYLYFLPSCKHKFDCG